MLRKADTPANKGKQEGVQAETEGDKTLSKRKQEGETRPSGRRTHHPTKGNKKGYNGRQDRQKGEHTIRKGKQSGVQ